MSGGALAAAVAAIGTLGVVLVAVVFYILLAAALWMLFLKMGEPGWKGIIPVYNVYTQYKHTWKKSMFGVLLACVILQGVLFAIGGDDPAALVSIAAAVLGLVASIIVIVGYYYLCKSFGHGIGWVALSILFPCITMLALGFGSSRYRGNAYLNRRR